jgi:Protein of unknown function (DUF2877)
MRLGALSSGPGVPVDDFTGRIEEVHARAVLLAIDGGRWVTLIAAQLGREPRAITLDLTADISLRAVLAPGADVAARGSMLRVAGGTLVIDLRRAKSWRSGIGVLQVDPRRSSVARAYRTALSALEADGRDGGLRDIAGTTLDMLARGTRHYDAAVAGRAMSLLIGVGEGRTPAGDDYLVGYFAALWASSRTSKSFAAALSTQLVALAKRTERLSRLYLEAVAQCEVSERIVTLAAGIAAGSDDTGIRLAVDAVLAVGHSSGAATLLGLLQGFAASAKMVPQRSLRLA